LESLLIGLQILIAALNLVIVFLLTRRQLLHAERFSSTQEQASSKQIDLLTAQIRKQYDWSMKQMALMFSISQNPTIQPARHALDVAFGTYIRESEPIPLNIIEEAIDKDPEIYTHVRTILAHYEVMAIAIHRKVADGDLARDLIAETLNQYIAVFERFMRQRRTVNRRAYEYMLDLDRKWERELADKRAEERGEHEDPRSS